MKRNKAKRSIYIRIFGAFLITYVFLMIGFCVFLVSLEKEAVGKELSAYSSYISDRLEEILSDNLDSSNNIKDIIKVKKEFIRKSLVPMHLDAETAVFTKDFELVYNTNDYLICNYTKNLEQNKSYDEYGMINLREWFSEEDVKKIIYFASTELEAKNVMDIYGYALHVDGWVDGEMIIPDKIYVNAMRAHAFDEEGNVSGGVGTVSYSKVFISGYKDAEGLPYIERGTVMYGYNENLSSENQYELRQMVTDESKLKSYPNLIRGTSYTDERVHMLTYRYYMVVPYQLTIKAADQGFYSDFWTTAGMDINLWDRVNSTMAYVSASCLIMFIFVAYILSRQTHKIYLKQEELDTKRKEMTDALAHDLKTPLSIISGYAQNLQDNVHTEKREHYAEHIMSNIYRMDEIIKKMLEMSKLSSDSFEINIEDVSLNDISVKIINRYKNICDEKHIKTYIDGEAVIKADKALIERVIDNFFVNALDNMDDGGVIRISIQDNTFEIYNNGSHIPEDIINDIWLPYKKGNADRSNTKGSGIGLSIVRTILELHKFPYGAENKEDGVTFWFKFK
ncbi:HAMP domain-containing sensor histidine kinase [Sedimentibacter sp.]|uniref:sensor histidine kinase n=1 Tax=Sedimentibacter sp. TaxID=1960295 RepID=UPI0028AC30E3|nr:HAMP domain-containing sensor histidine kinase [Sedimentibacter sp.]